VGFGRLSPFLLVRIRETAEQQGGIFRVTVGPNGWLLLSCRVFVSETKSHQTPE